MSRIHRQRQIELRRQPTEVERAKESASGLPQQAVVTTAGSAAPQDMEPVQLTARAKVMEQGTGRKAVIWWNDGPDDAYRGGQGVTTANGIPMTAGEGYIDELAPNGELYMVSAGTSTIRRQVLK